MTPMRKKRSQSEVVQPVSVGLYPSELAFIQARASVVGSVSRYLRLLAAYDREHNIIAEVLKSQVERVSRK